MREIINPPNAAAIVSSLRSLGYSFGTAISDIIDNSIAAEAKTIDINIRVLPEPYVAIVDDGCGMTDDDLISAMQHGGRGPEQTRRPSDLGRFGLGLKTASLSQCRRLTVITAVAGEISAAQWDVDEIEQRNDWVLRLLSPEDIAQLPCTENLNGIQHGTTVLWQRFDKLIESPNHAHLEKLVDDSREQLSLIFHRFMQPGGDAGSIAISINGLRLDPIDPFLLSNKHTEKLPLETALIDGQLVAVQPYILPHLSNIKEQEAASLGGRQGLRQSQGFYLYRNCRLITAGTWFRLIAQDQLTKLARVRIDIPNSLDRAWDLDIKKSSARPPEEMRILLKRIIDRIADRSQNVFRERRRRRRADQVTRLWERELSRAGASYRVNRNHPSVQQLTKGLKAKEKRSLESLLRMIELGLPADSIYSDMASDRAVEPNVGDLSLALKSQAVAWLDRLSYNRAARDKMLNALPLLEPFSMYPAVTRKIMEELQSVYR